MAMGLPLALWLLHLGLNGVVSECPCYGVSLMSTSDSTLHCFQIVTPMASSWVDADEACQEYGGHIAHPETVEDLSTLKDYIESTTSDPVLTGIVAANADTGRYAVMCPDNSFYGLLDPSASFIKMANNATVNMTCAFLETSTNDIEYIFDSCLLSSKTLCDIPLQQPDYCNSLATCTSSALSTTIISSTSLMTDVSSSSSDNSISTGSTSTINFEMTSSETTITTISNPNVTNTQSSQSAETGSTITQNDQPATGTTSPTSGSTNSSETTDTTADSKNPNPDPNPGPNPGDGSSGNGSSITADLSTDPDQPLSSIALTISTSVQNPAGTTTAPCPARTDCLEHQWSIFGMCVDWRALLACLLLFLGLLLLCCCCHCCLHRCMFCRPKEQAKKDAEKRPIRMPQVHPIPPVVPIPMDKNHRPIAPPRVESKTIDRTIIDEEPKHNIEMKEIKKDVLYRPESRGLALVPPAPAVSAAVPSVADPLIITVPKKSEKVYGFHTKEIRVIEAAQPIKPETRDKRITIKPMPLAKIRQQGNPIPEDDDIADEISLREMSKSPDVESVAPLGDFHAELIAPVIASTPYVFVHNPKPEMPEIPPVHHHRRAPPVQKSPANVITAIGSPPRDPQSISSPPPVSRRPAREVRPRSSDQPRRSALAPTEAVRPNKRARSVSPLPASTPPQKASRPARNDQPIIVQPMVPASRSEKSQVRSAPPSSKAQPSSESLFKEPSKPSGGLMRSPNPDVSMRAPRGRLGGVVKAGGGDHDGPTPIGWKPWTKGASALGKKRPGPADL